jgi:hypothetical protein
MKLKDYFSALKSQAKITDEAYDSFLNSDIPDYEIPDAAKAVIEKNFMTLDRAATDPAVVKRAKAEFYNAIDANISDLLGELSTFDKHAIDNEKDTHRKLKMLGEAQKKRYEDLKKVTPEDTKKHEELQRAVQDLTARLDNEKKITEKAVKEAKEEVAKMQQDFVKKEKSVRVKADLIAKLNGIEFAKEIAENPVRKNDAMNSIMTRILNNEIDYDSSGNMIVHDGIVDGVPKPKFYPGTNDQVTVEKLLETETSHYIKKSNGDDKIHRDLEKTRKTILDSSASGKKLTLAEMRVAEAQQGG